MADTEAQSWTPARDLAEVETRDVDGVRLLCASQFTMGPCSCGMTHIRLLDKNGLVFAEASFEGLDEVIDYLVAARDS